MLSEVGIPEDNQSFNWIKCLKTYNPASKSLDLKCKQNQNFMVCYQPEGFNASEQKPGLRKETEKEVNW